MGIVIGAVIFVGFFVVLMLMAVGLYNGIKRKSIAADAAWSDIDVQLKRRHDLIPNLVNTVKGYAAHEKDTLDAVISARAKAVNAVGPAAKAQAEGELSQVLGRLMVLSEAYPNLKANENFLALQEELTGTENKISFSRQYYNRSAQQYNEAITLFPGVMLASMMGFKSREYFEVEDKAEREAPAVQF